ncbi:PAS domain-containing protein [Streptomyces sp. R02]|uniref:PAS domain-containing protein n=1 Tax=Streptomyces sp. R02 TaxID=3238623 RepID=A0AB39LFC7_9ACTN
MVTPDQPTSGADLSDTALVVLDDDGTVTAWALAARRLTGHAPGEAVGRTAARLLPGARRTRRRLSRRTPRQRPARRPGGGVPRPV